MSGHYRKIVLAGTIGTLLEWLEFSLYGYLATQIARLFFPPADSQFALIITFGIFAAGFLTRPLGAIVFGHIGDKYGRKKALTASILFMGISTLSIGLLPTYAHIGVVAPLLLLACRLSQGFAVSGEFHGAAVFLLEHAQDKHPYLNGSWVGTATAAGMLLGASAASIVSGSHMPPWAWRVPFMLGFLGSLVGLYLRAFVSETPIFTRIQQEKKLVNLPLLNIIRNHRASMLQTAALAAFTGIYIYTCNVYFTTFLIKKAFFNTQTAIFIAAFGQAFVVLFFPIIANIADKIGGRTIMLLGLIGAAIIAPLVFRLAQMNSIVLACFGQLLYAFFNASVFAPMFKFLYDLFPPEVRYTGKGVPWDITTALFGGTAPLVAQYLTNYLNLSEGPAIYVSLSAMIAFIAVLFSRCSQMNKSLHSLEKY